MKKLILIILIIALVSPLKAEAHPGRTDSSGGHSCWTKCEKWGLTSGQYHKHNDGATAKKAKTTAKAKSK